MNSVTKFVQGLTGKEQRFGDAIRENIVTSIREYETELRDQAENEKLTEEYAETYDDDSAASTWLREDLNEGIINSIHPLIQDVTCLEINREPNTLRRYASLALSEKYCELVTKFQSYAKTEDTESFTYLQQHSGC